MNRAKGRTSRACPEPAEGCAVKVFVFVIPSGLQRVSENCTVPKGTRIYFPLYPALRLRLRAGLN